MFHEIKFRTQFGMGFLAISILLISSCAKEEEEPPTLPPTISFVVAYDDYPASKAIFKSIDETSTLPSFAAGTVFGEAAVRVAAWKLVTDIAMLIPRAAFLEAFNHRPTQKDDGSWEWTYTVSVLFKAYQPRLKGWKDKDTGITHWEMYITALDGSYSNFLWYSGTYNADRSAGQWVLKKDYNTPTDYLQIDWTYSSTLDAGSIKYTVIDATSSDNGAYISYGKSTNATYDAYFDINNVALSNLVNINWNIVNKDGRIRMSNGSISTNIPVADTWYCWDTTLANSTCP